MVELTLVLYLCILCNTIFKCILLFAASPNWSPLQSKNQKHKTVQTNAHGTHLTVYYNNNNSCIALYPVKFYKLAALYIVNINILLTIKYIYI